MVWKAYLCKDSLVVQNPWMSELHRPLKQVNDTCLIACDLSSFIPAKRFTCSQRVGFRRLGYTSHSLFKRLLQHKGFFPNG